MSTNQILRTARNYIARGWTQRAYSRRDGEKWQGRFHKDADSWCVLGALRAAVEELELPYESRLAAEEELAILVPKSLSRRAHDRIASFNDHLGMTQETVLALFDKAITATIPVIPEST